MSQVFEVADRQDQDGNWQVTKDGDWCATFLVARDAFIFRDTMNGLKTQPASPHGSPPT